MSNKQTPHSEIRIGLAQYGKHNKPKAPDLSTLQHEDELRPLKWQHGVRRFPPKADHVTEHKKPPTSSIELEDNPPFLWVALKDRIKIVNEKANATKRLALKKAKHTNLTGGSKAYSGGEMWITAPKTIVLNGCSGRYGPRTAEQLSEIVKVVRRSGWQVISLGWDDETARPVKYPR
ncbi:hypothetical protein [Pseudodesulfovibrio methanolicus]|uniref:Uncharacterized protein n=1 Tax=Pseudodesulfovibrio methanolicus TaxID=3126690 RepID=A0ABZ2J5L2_9BACT